MASDTALELHQVKGLLTKVMRMLFPLEFRIDSLANLTNALPFRFPFANGEVVHLPESVDGLGSHDDCFDYYLMLAAHLAGRHEFGTYDIRSLTSLASKSAAKLVWKRSRRSSGPFPTRSWPAL